MHTHPSDTPYPNLQSDVAVVDGYGIAIRVERRHLVIHDGLGRRRGTRRYSRATCPIRRIVILGREGYVSLEAMRWCVKVGIQVIHLDRDGELLATSVRPDLKVARLRRVQALATFTDVGLEVTREILAEKIQGQANTARRLPSGSEITRVLEDAAVLAAGAATIEEALEAEAHAAQDYWTAWGGVRPTFARRDEPCVPEHWRTAGPRSTAIGNAQRHAITPAHAILNYLYRLLEAETTLGLHAAGLDPAIGVFHRDDRYRDSLTLDVMEAARPVADAYALDVLAQPLRLRDFDETDRGVVRVVAPVTHRLAEAMPMLRDAVEPIILRTAALLDREPELRAGHISFATPRNREATRRRTVVRSGRTPSRRTCLGCGDTLASKIHPTQRYCATCRDNGFDPHRSARQGPTHDPGRVLQGQVMRARNLARRQWDRTHPIKPDPKQFSREILPGLQARSIRSICRATGLSHRYVKTIRDGGQVPHPVHWPALASFANGLAAAGPTPDLARPPARVRPDG
jgi:CRISPR-associated protein Cas1